MLNTAYGGPPFPIIRRKRKSMLLAEPKQEPHRERIEPERETPATPEAGGSSASDGAQQRLETAATNDNHAGQSSVLDKAGSGQESAAPGRVELGDLPEDEQPYEPTATPAAVAEPKPTAPSADLEKAKPHGVDVQSGRRNRSGRQQ